MDKKNQNTLKQRLAKAAPYLDILNPLLSSLWLLMSFAPLAISFISLGNIPPNTVLQAFLISEIGFIIFRHTASFTAWSLDNTTYIDNRKKHDNFSSSLRLVQLALVLVSTMMSAVSSLHTVFELQAKITTVFNIFIHNPALALIANISSYVPLVSAVAGLLGTVYYLYQARQASQDRAYYQKKIDHIDKNDPNANKLYQQLLAPKANIAQLCRGLSGETSRYLFERHFLATKKQASQQEKRNYLFWAGLCAVSVGLAVLGGVAALTPVGAAVIAGGVTVAVAVKVCVIAGLLIISAATALNYIKNKYYNSEQKQIEKHKQRIDKAIKYIAANDRDSATTPQYDLTYKKIMSQGAKQGSPTEKPITTPNQHSSTNHSFFQATPPSSPVATPLDDTDRPTPRLG